MFDAFRLIKIIDPVAIVVGGLVPKGVYSGATAYAQGDSVSYNGASYVALGPTTGNLPTNTTYWQLISAQGPAGAPSTVPGPPGANGLVTSIVAGTGISVNSATPSAPIISADFTADTLHVLRAGDTMTGTLNINIGGLVQPTLTNPTISIVQNANATVQGNIMNLSSGGSASSDWVATADTGSDTSNYVNMGINSSGYSNPAYTVVGALGSYLYSDGGDLAIGAQTAGKKLIFHTGGSLAANIRAIISDTAIQMNVATINDSNANPIIGLNAVASSTAYLTVSNSATGNVTLATSGSATDRSIALTANGNASIKLYASGTGVIQGRGAGTFNWDVQSATTFNQTRNTTAGGQSMTIQAQGGLSGATDAAGGNLVLTGGQATGGAQGIVQIRAFGPLSGVVKTITLNAGGTGYTAGDILTIETGGGNATVTVSTVSAGVVTGISLTSAGTGYTVANAQPTTGGTGAGAKINVTALTGASDNGQQTVMQIANGGAGSAVTVTPVTASQNMMQLNGTVIMAGNDISGYSVSLNTASVNTASGKTLGGLYGQIITSRTTAAAGTQFWNAAAKFDPVHSGASTLTNMKAFLATPENTGAGTITTVNGAEISVYPSGVGGTIGSVNGFIVSGWGSTNGSVNNLNGLVISAMGTTVALGGFNGISIGTNTATGNANGINIGTITGGATVSGISVSAVNATGGSGAVSGLAIGNVTSSGSGPARAIKTATGQVEFGDAVAILGTSGVATHSLTLGSTATGVAFYNTSDQTTNYERVTMAWASNTFNIRTGIGGTGTLRSLQIGTTNRLFAISDNTSGTTGFFNFTPLTTNATGTGVVTIGGGSSAGAGIAIWTSIQPTMTQSAGAGYTALQINVTETSVGSGNKFLADFQVGGSSKFTVDNAGHVTITGQLQRTVVSPVATGSVALTTHSELISTGASAVTRTLYTPVGHAGEEVYMQKVDAGAGVVTIATAAGTIIGGITSLATQFKRVTYISDGTNWIVKDNN